MLERSSNLTSETIGVYSLGDSFNEHLSLTLYPDSSPVRWNLCNLTANFMAEYFAELFPETDVEGKLLSRAEISGAIGFVLNELVENAVAHTLLNGPINEKRTLILAVRNGAIVCTEARSKKRKR